jgi:hypothetical protein
MEKTTGFAESSGFLRQKWPILVKYSRNELETFSDFARLQMLRTSTLPCG